MRTAPRLQDDAPAGEPLPARALAPGVRLRDYEITGLIGEGSLSVIYLAWDRSLQRKVAIKEYLPAALSTRAPGGGSLVLHGERDADGFRAGLKSFVSEARLLARFDHPSLVKVYRFWEDNGTAYRVMPYYEGPTLQTALAELGHVPSEAELRTWLRPILDAVTRLHEGGTQHLNLGPEQIVLTPIGPVLLGFDAARGAIATVQGAPASALKPGYAALEQYDSALSECGPWTDLYALGAILHTAIAGEPPQPALERRADDKLKPLALVAAGLYSPGFLAAIDAALALAPQGRPADDVAFRALMGDMDAPPVAVSLAPRRDLMQEPFIGDTPGPREVTVPDHPLLLGTGLQATPAPADEAKPKAPLRLPAGEAAPSRAAAREASRWADTVDSEATPAPRTRRSAYGVIAAGLRGHRHWRACFSVRLSSARSQRRLPGHCNGADGDGALAQPGATRRRRGRGQAASHPARSERGHSSCNAGPGAGRHDGSCNRAIAHRTRHRRPHACRGPAGHQPRCRHCAGAGAAAGIGHRARAPGPLHRDPAEGFARKNHSR